MYKFNFESINKSSRPYVAEYYGTEDREMERNFKLSSYDKKTGKLISNFLAREYEILDIRYKNVNYGEDGFYIILNGKLDYLCPINDMNVSKIKRFLRNKLSLSEFLSFFDLECNKKDAELKYKDVIPTTKEIIIKNIDEYKVKLTSFEKTKSNKDVKDSIDYDLMALNKLEDKINNSKEMSYTELRHMLSDEIEYSIRMKNLAFYISSYISRAFHHYEDAFETK